MILILNWRFYFSSSVFNFQVVLLIFNLNFKNFHHLVLLFLSHDSELELVTREFELTTCDFELVIRGF